MNQFRVSFTGACDLDAFRAALQRYPTARQVGERAWRLEAGCHPLVICIRLAYFFVGPYEIRVDVLG
jgi:hypothetical protein